VDVQGLPFSALRLAADYPTGLGPKGHPCFRGL
jgi:hypothetical protein